MSDIFISYARQDQAIVRKLAAVFEEQGWSVFWDAHIRTGETFDTVIERELHAARCIVVLWSRDAKNSHWVLSEAHIASQRKVLFPARIDNVALPTEFVRYQTADLSGWKGRPDNAGLLSILRDMSSFLGDGGIKLPPASHDTLKHWSFGLGALVLGGVTAAVFMLQTHLLDRGPDPDNRKVLEKEETDERQKPDALSSRSATMATVLKPEPSIESSPPIPVPPDTSPPKPPNGLDFRVERGIKGAPVAINLSWTKGNNPQNLATEYRVYRFPYDDEPPLKPTTTVQKSFFRDTQMQWCKKLRYAVSAIGESGGESRKTYLNNVVIVYQRLDPPKILSCKRRDDGYYDVEFASILETQHCSFAAFRVERCTNLAATVPSNCASKSWEGQRCMRRNAPTGAQCTLLSKKGAMYRASVGNQDGYFSDLEFFRLEGEGCI